MKNKPPIRLLLTGGGTGGHLFPAIATAEAFCRRHPGTEILFVGTKRKMDKISLTQHGFAAKGIHCQGLKGKGALALAQALFLLPVSFMEACWHILHFRPQLVVGVGGYVTGPVVAAARMLGRPTLIHEQNSVPGMANRKLGLLATRICLSLPGSEAFFPAGKTVVTGNPVRHQILELAGKASAMTNRAQQRTILILGGSLGAHRVNEMVVEALTGYRHLLPAGLQILHQTGAADEAMVRLAYEQAKITATVAAFFTDMAAVYEKCDLLVSRAGATTLAELAVLGKPAVLIPYPFAADDHQYKNGCHYADRGGAILLVERALTAGKLAATLADLLGNPAKLVQMAEAMRTMGRPEAADKIVDNCLDIMQQSNG